MYVYMFFSVKSQEGFQALHGNRRHNVLQIAASEKIRKHRKLTSRAYVLKEKWLPLKIHSRDAILKYTQLRNIKSKYVACIHMPQPFKYSKQLFSW